MNTVLPNQRESPQPRILIVDDNPSIHADFRKILCPQLSESRFAVVAMVEELFSDAPKPRIDARFDMDSALQGKEAVAKVALAEQQGRPYSVAFVDVRMPPGWDGIETVLRLWEIAPELQIVICTAYSDYSQLQMFDQLGRTDNLLILKKPFDNLEALQLAHTLSRKWSLSRELQNRMRGLEMTVDQEIAEKVKAEELLRESEEMHRLFFEMGAVGMVYAQTDGHLLKVNDKYCEITGYARAELDQMTVFDLTHPDDRQKDRQVFGAYIQGNIPVYGTEKRYLRKDGSIRWVAVAARLIHDAHGQPRHSIAIVEDITDRKRAEEERIVLSKLESTGVLAGGIAHDYNNLLNAIRLNLEMVASGMTSGRDVSVFLQSARQGTLAAQNLTRQLIAFAKGGTPVRKPIVISDLVQASVTLALSGSNVRGDVTVDTDLFCTDVDEGQIGQVIRNLVLNARDAMPSGGIVQVRAQNATLAAREVAALPAGNYVRIAVIDQGHGISQEVLPRIFDPYFSTKLRDEDKGMGLGLTICHTIVKKHEGAITVKSLVGSGTTFQIYLPVWTNSKQDQTAGS